VAVKLFTLDLPPERTHQLVAELERLVAADLTHPALAAPLATGISGVSAFLAQDYVAADSLDLAVREYGPAPVADALRVAAQLAGALDFAAAVQVSHGALHPRDVLLSSDDTRLTGLGITRALHRIGVVAPVRRPYTAPERIAGGEWDRRADVFSLAALMHELIWGRRVSGLGARAADLLTGIEGTSLPALKDVFARALAENAADRFETALGFAEALRNACPDVAIATEAPASAKRKAVRDEAPRLPLDETLAPPLLVPPTPSSTLPLRDPIVVPDTLVPADTAAPDVDLAIVPAPAADIAFRSVNDARLEPLSETVVAGPVPTIAAHEAESFSALDRTRSAVWPLVLALVVGIAIGFAGGFFAGSREQPAATAATAAAPERHVNEPVAATAPASPAPAPAPPKTDAGSQTAQSEGRKSPGEAPKPPAPDGRILVRSRPAGARVTVDGKDYGATPATVRGLTYGAHNVKVVRDGYAAEERRFVVSAARPAQSMTLELEQSRAAAASPRAQTPVATQGRFVGALAVDSRPTGAKVFVDGALVGTTPMALPSVPAGSHAIRLEHDGYRHWSSSVRIVASEQNRVTASLER
jgi:hypothetical protein